METSKVRFKSKEEFDKKSDVIKMRTSTLDNKKTLAAPHELDISDDIQSSVVLGCMPLENEILNILKKYEYDFGVILPCSKIKNLINLIEKEPSIKIIPITREEEGVGICAGAYLAGKKPFMLIQSSGLGNSFNALTSLIKTYKIPLFILASYRGYHNEKILAQIPLGNALPKMLEALEIPYLILKKGIGKLEKFCEANLNNGFPYIILLSPELFEDV